MNHPAIEWNEVSDRLDKYQKEKRMSSEKMAKALGYKTVQGFYKIKNTPDSIGRIVERISAGLEDLSLDWLYKGVGSMFLTNIDFQQSVEGAGGDETEWKRRYQMMQQLAESRKSHIKTLETLIKKLEGKK